MSDGRCFAGRTVVVTGGASGLGFACAAAFARAGAETIIVGRTTSTLQAAVTRLRQGGGSARSIICDVTDDAAVEAALGSLDRCDVLLSNAGTNVPQPFLAVDRITLDKLLALNLRAAFVVSQTIARGMVKRASGVILHMSSQMGHVGAPKRTVYCMTKHALEGLTKAMALELAPHGVRVVSLAPTYIETQLTRVFLDEAAFKAEALGRIPLGRFGTPDEVAAAAVFLASDAAALVTGSSLLLDGGYVAA